MRLDSIDVARGGAALAVAFYHHGFAQALSNSTKTEAYQLLAWPGAVLAVPLFFVISGFCIHLPWTENPHRTQSVQRFFWQRFFRIYPPWLLAVLLSAAGLLLTEKLFDARQFLFHLTLTNGFVADYGLNAALWSVSVEVCLYALYPGWLWFRTRHGLAPAIILAGSVSLLSCLVTARLFPIPTGPSLWFFLNVWIGWVAGAALAEYHQRTAGAYLRHRAWWLAGLGSLGVFGLMDRTGCFIGETAFIRLPLLIVLCCWLLSLLLLIGSWREQYRRSALIDGIWQFLVTVGSFSYSLYLLHIPLQRLRFPLHNLLAGHRWAQFLLFTGWFLLVLAFAWLTYRYVEKPSIEFGRTLLRRQFDRARFST